MTESERVTFEELLDAGTRAVRKLGKSMPLAEVLIYSMRYTKAANAAEEILDPLRSPLERLRVEDGIR